MPESMQETVPAVRGREGAPAFGTQVGGVADSSGAAATAPPRRSARPVNIDAAERAVSLAAGCLLAFYGLRRRSRIAGLPVVALGTALAYRGVSGRSKAYRRLGVQHAGEPVKLVQSVTVNRPVEDVYAFWRRLENLPKFMRHIRRVEVLSETRSRWTAEAGRMRRAVEWESEIIEDRPNELIRWRSVTNGAVQHSGEVRFRRAPGNRGTEVHLHIDYRPAYGSAVAALGYPFNKQMLKEEVRRFKRVLEAGEISTIEGQPSGRRASARGGAP